MQKACEYCGKVFVTEYPSKIFCDKKCAKKAALKRDESYYDFPHDPDANPIHTFKCANCGKTVNVYSKYDQRIKFCCGQCAKKFAHRQYAAQNRKRSGSNIGMSGAMSLGSLIRREARDLK